MKIVVTDYIESDLSWERQRMAEWGVAFEAYQLKHASEAELIAQVCDADVLIVNMAKISRSVMAGLRSCKLIIRHGVGYDNIDVPAATEAGIQVCYVPDYCREEVAEQAMMLLLALSTTVHAAAGIARKLDHERTVGLFCCDACARFSGMKAGLVGCGRIGATVLRMLRGFGIDVMVHDPYLSDERQKELGIRCIALEEVLAKS